jgi:hypothetical protein
VLAFEDARAFGDENDLIPLEDPSAGPFKMVVRRVIVSRRFSKKKRSW